MVYHVLIVDDNEIQRAIYEEIILDMTDYRVSSVESGKTAIEVLQSDINSKIDMVLLDLVMPEMDGFEVLQKINSIRPKLPVIIHTAFGNIKKAVEALQLGAMDFVDKKKDPDYLRIAIDNIRRMSQLQAEVSRLKRASDGMVTFADIVGSSKTLEETKEIARRASRSNIPVLIKGRSGVGKEIFARAIHGESLRLGHPFIAINCGAIPDNLVESILFGHEKGSFTGAFSKTIGKFREANEGTIFLDEVGELKPDIQVKLLRVLQEGEVEPVGAGKPVDINVRIISATNRNLKEEVRNGTFREDLYYRLNVFPFTIPPLCDHPEDIPELLEFFCQHIAISEQCSFSGLSENAKKLLSEYKWPGNIRQLENSCYRAVVLSNNNRLDVEDFQHIVRTLKNPSSPSPSHEHTLSQLGEATLNPNILSVLNNDDHFKTLSEIEAETILSALDYYNWRISEVARRLNIGRSTLYRKMEEYHIREQPRKISHQHHNIA